MVFLRIIVTFHEGHSYLTLRLYSGDRARGTNPLTSFSSSPPSDLSGALHYPDPIRSYRDWDPVNQAHAGHQGRVENGPGGTNRR